MKIDLKKELSIYYNPSVKGVQIVELPTYQYLMIDGHGDPNTSKEYQEAVEALFSVSYALKFTIKKAQGIDYTVMPLEGLWWGENGAFNIEDKNSWNWSAMILQPEYVTPDLFNKVLNETIKKKDLRALKKIRWETYQEGLAAQIMHIGPYSAEGPTIERIYKYITENNYSLRGRHHEIYLSDPRRTSPEKLKTILRQPIQ